MARYLDKDTTRLVQEALNQIHKIDVGIADGLWGSKTSAGVTKYKAKYYKKNEKEIVESLSGWPADNTTSLRNFYGREGNESDLVWFKMPYEMRLYSRTGQKLKKHRCHKLVKVSLEGILEDARDTLGMDFIIEHGLNVFCGVYNHRPMRGRSKSVSRHSWGVAIDINCAENAFRTPWYESKIGQKGYGNMPVEFIDIFEKHGWKSGARAWNKDAMHFQATK